MDEITNPRIQGFSDFANFYPQISRELGSIEAKFDTMNVRLSNIEDMQKQSIEERRLSFSVLESKMETIRSELHAHSKDLENLKTKAAMVALFISTIVSGAFAFLPRFVGH